MDRPPRVQHRPWNHGARACASWDTFEFIPIKPKFLPLKKRILLGLLRCRGNGMSVYWEHHPQELECPLLEGGGLCELTERQPIQARCHATTVATTGPEGSQQGMEAVDGQALGGQPAGLFLLGGA